MSEQQDLALVRHELLNQLFVLYPRSCPRPKLLQGLSPTLVRRDQAWLSDAVNEQIKVLQHAGLVRPLAGGYTLTERGRMDRLATHQAFRNRRNNGARDKAGDL